MNHLKIMTDEDRAKSLAVKEEKKAYALAHLKTVYTDEVFWRELSSLYSARLPQWYFPNTETKYIRRMCKTLGVDLNEYLEYTGFTTLNQYVQANPEWTAFGLTSLVLEWYHYNKSADKPLSA